MRSTWLKSLLMAIGLLFVLIPELYGQLINVASAANGGIATATSSYAGYPASAVNNGDRSGFNTTNGTPNFWNDNTLSAYSDRVRVDFNGYRMISEIKVVTLQDDYQTGAEPAVGETFVSYGIVDFTVEYLDENGVFITVPGGVVTGNNQVTRQFMFTAVRAQAVRVSVTRDGPQPPEYSRVVEIEAMGQPLDFSLSAASNNFRLFGTGFSISKTLSPDTYHAFVTGSYDGMRGVDGNSDGDFLDENIDKFVSIYSQTSFGGGTGACNMFISPNKWTDLRCGSDSINHLSKQVTCPPGGNVACQGNDRWNGWPGSYNVTTFPSPAVWPRTGTAFGVAGMQGTIYPQKINQVALQPADAACGMGNAPCPPKTGRASICHQYNPDEFATGAANSKAVQVKYANGSTKWFMAFNSMIKNSGSGNPFSAADNWRVLWATSPDGGTWTVHDQILFRSIGETQQCWRGFLMTDMFTDNGYFYILLNDLDSSKTYMLRSPINSSPASNPGYGTWSVATLPANATQYTWVPVGLGTVLDLSQTAASIFPSQQPSQILGVKQASVGRVFSSTNSAVSRYIGVTNDLNPFGNVIVQLWSTADITKPFIFEKELNFSQVPIGGNGWEFGFTHYADNVQQTPRMLGNGFDFWMVENYSPWTSANFFPNAVTVTKRTATLTGL